jgi:multiple sugar transport system ATP-binding protein
MRDGTIQPVDAPQRLYENPANLFVAAFIGSPAMNLAKARVEDGAIALGSIRLPLGGAHVPALPGEEIILGIRPEAFEDSAFADPSLPRIEVVVRVLEELGADAHVFFEVDAEAVIVEDALAEDEDERTLIAERDRPLFTARVDPRTAARIGGTIRLALDPTRLYFFSPVTGESLTARDAVAA